jgi:hypothetical protein
VSYAHGKKAFSNCFGVLLLRKKMLINESKTKVTLKGSNNNKVSYAHGKKAISNCFGDLFLRKKC